MRGMTWNHPRGIAPLRAAADVWHKRAGRSIEWDARSLQDFETFPVEELAERYDLIVIDHPHVGAIAATGALHPLDDHPDAAAGSIGGSYESYRWEDRQWALPIDAAAQVQAWVPDRIAAAPTRWDEVLRLADAGRVALPMRPPHSLMCLMSLCGLAGFTLDPSAERLFPGAAEAPAAQLIELVRCVGLAALERDPIAVLDAMASPRSPIAVAPLIYGYVSYAAQAAAPTRIAFADLIGVGLPRGSVLGGTGIAVSSRGRDIAAATDFARWLASGEVQRTIVARNGGQPAHALAWADAEVNEASAGFYANTRATLDGAWVRPRHSGYMRFQDEGSAIINDAIRAGLSAECMIDDLNAAWRISRPTSV